jgi:Holliday junction DNA helicase RuvA
MIGRLSGTLLAKSPPALLVDVGGVGYELEAPMSTFYRLPSAGEPVILHTHLLVREDAQLLYGFASEAERVLFRQLLKVGGVGAKLALVILSGVGAQELFDIGAGGDAARLVRVPGIGRKTAERLILELREPLARLGAVAPANAAVASAGGSDVRQDAASALEALGYKPTEARAALRDLPIEGQRSEDLIRAALKRLMRG